MIILIINIVKSRGVTLDKVLYMLTDVAEIHFLEYPKFRRLHEKNYRDNAMERWLAFLEKDISEDTLRELVKMEPAIEKAENKLEYLSSDEEMMSIYLAREKSLHDKANMINSAEQRGLQQGLQQGREARNIELAKSLLDVPDDETISIKTGISIEWIKKFREEV